MHRFFLAVLLALGSMLGRPAAAQPPIYLTQWSAGGINETQFYYPVGGATDAGGDVFVKVSYLNRILTFTGQRQCPHAAAAASSASPSTSRPTYITQWGSLGSGNGESNSPMGVATDGAGNVFVADSRNYRIQKFGPAATPATSTTWGRLKTLYR